MAKILPSRRAVLGMFGAAGLLATTGAAEAGDDLNPFGPGRVPRDVLPGGSYDRHIADLAAQDRFSGTVLVAHRGRPVLARAYGMADRERSIPNRVDTIYALASASKPFVGLAIVQLAQQGKLRFGDKLGAHLQGYPADVAEKVTVHHLLTHTAGMSDPRWNPPPERTYHSVEEQMRDQAADLRREELRFAPGSQSSYSSSGMAVLGEIVEKVTGRTFWDYVRDHVFRPAGMTRSDYYTRPQWLADERIAHPYMLQESGERVDGVRHLDKGGKPGKIPGGGQIPGGNNSARNFIGTAAGNGFSTAPDLVRFARALTGHKLLNRAYTELFVGGKHTGPRPHVGNPDPAAQESFMAYGVTASVFNNQRLIGHGGGIAGGSTNWTIYLDSDWTGVILSNYDYDSYDALSTIISRERHAVTDPHH
ncbi:serine hydrolase domain-containing protein [Streptoalloteichus hindustanus]|uniref:CubicO group peptidase, beta-lactamase class C family n=1 Tax=Streptoalloteichus hindustanus TaxID=2017 RepID=A0A1M5NJE0_STRHI|nr:serine hydrolase domain-containing protein [Streptoalloteichus hindustanus]SHG89641.1 CubicO group peptidase, beta-lactamase class C family [Streptoalloteichus hindustanus]